MRKVVILFFLIFLFFGVCGEDDYVYFNVLIDMIDLKIDYIGIGWYLIMDEGIEWCIQLCIGFDGLVLDIMYCMVIMYVLLIDLEEVEKEVMFYNI